MEVYVLNRDFISIKMIDEFESFIWTDRYYECGDFELFLSMDKDLVNYIVKGYYLWFAESEHIMIIEDFKIKTDVEDGNKLIVTGRSLESILERRIIWGQKICTGNLQEMIQGLLTEAIISPSISDRAIGNFVYEASTDSRITALTIDAQYFGDDLYSIISGLCMAYDIGFKITLNSSNKFVFSLYCGSDHSYEQSENPYVIFSPNFENIINSDYYESNSNLKNVTLVAGEGEGADCKTIMVGSASGLDRREIFTDARHISSTVDGRTLSMSEYEAQLTQKGNDTLAEKTLVKAFEGEAETTQMFVYGVDFFIGDIVQVENEYGHEGRAYITEIIFSQDEGGISIYPTFSTIQDEGDD